MSVNDPDTVALLSAFEKCKGSLLQKEMRGLRVTQRIFTMNAGELRKSLEEFNHPSVIIHLWDNRNREFFDEYYGEIQRALHNFLASAKSLVDHSRAFVQRNYKLDAFAREFKLKVGESFANCGIVAFVHDLRNYMLHSWQPPTKARLNIPSSMGEATTSAVYLEVTVLRRWSRWSSRANEYLSQLRADPNLLDVVNAYEAVLYTFYAWLSQRIEEMHEHDFEEFHQLAYQLDRLGHRDAEPGGA